MKLIKIFIFSELKQAKEDFKLVIISLSFCNLFSCFHVCLCGERKLLPRIKVEATLHLRPINEWFLKASVCYKLYESVVVVENIAGNFPEMSFVSLNIEKHRIVQTESPRVLFRN